MTLEKSCKGKITYLSLSEAKRVKKQMKATGRAGILRGQNRLEEYYCENCDRFHLGHRPTSAF